jgi:hypothetical protein
LQTNGSGSAPTFVAPSGLTTGFATNISGGVAGAVPYQSAIGTTGFTAAGTSSQVLLSGGTGSPTWASQSTLSVGYSNNLNGGAAGSLPYQTGSNATAFIAAGTNGYVLTMVSGSPAWAALPATGVTIVDDTSTNAVRYLTFTSATSGNITTENVSSTRLQFNPSTGALTSTSLTPTNALGATYGGTAQTSYATGDILYASAANTLSKLAAGTNGYVLTLSGGVPTWAAGASGGVSSFSAGTTGFTPNTATTGAVTLAGTLATTNGGTGLTAFTANGIVYASSTSALTTGSALTFNGTDLATTGKATAARLVVTGSTVPGGSLSGLYLPSASNLGLYSGGYDVARLSPVGIGIFGGGTAFSPFAKLQISTTNIDGTTYIPSTTNSFGLYVSGGSVSGFPGGGSSATQVNVNSIARTTLDFGDIDTAFSTTTATTLYIANAPAAGTYNTISNSYALYVAAGTSYFGGSVNLAGGLTGALTVSGGTLTASYTSGNKLAISGNISQSPWTLTGPALSVAAGTYTSTSTLTATVTASSFAQPTFAATTASQTITNGATVYIAAAPANGTNVTITNPYALYIAAGASYFGGAVTLSTALTATNGGTGFNTYATGDLIYASATNTLSKLAAGTNGYVLTLSSGVPTWAASTGGVTSIAGTTNQITASASTGAVTLSLPATVTVTGTLTGAIVAASNGIHTNSKTVSASYSIPSGSSAMSVGPITVASGQTVTVPSGSKWVVL